MNLTKHQWFYHLVLFLAVLTHMTGLLNDVFLSDSALYASIAKEMVLSGDWWDLTYDGKDWLDKPHFHFWVTALSYHVFGINAFAYKLPAILFTLLAFYYTYRLAADWYDRDTALLAVLILATAQHLILSNNDVRAEPILTGLIIAGIYYYHRLIREYRFLPLLLASVFAAAAMMTKGLFALIPIAGAVAGELLLKRQWSRLFSSRWILSLVLLTLLISPEIYALYRQFDSQPEKIVFGSTGVSGIRFFLWESQFGRFFNTGPIRGSGDPFFFLHTLLWAFLPWALLAYYMIYRKIRDYIPRIRHEQELLTISGALFAILMFSFSRFQLPHYTNVIFPLLAILTAGFFRRVPSRAEIRFFRFSQWTIIILMMMVPILLQFLFRPPSAAVLATAGLFMAAGAWILRSLDIDPARLKLFYLSCLASICLNLYLNLSFYPALLEYQSGSKAAAYLYEHHPATPVRTLGVLSFTLHFHADAEVRDYRYMDDLPETGEEYLLFTRDIYLDSLDARQIDYRRIRAFDHYHITRLNGRFLNHQTRREALRQQYLLEINPPH